jgi:hemerythrin-like domain-containing protein
MSPRRSKSGSRSAGRGRAAANTSSAAATRRHGKRGRRTDSSASYAVKFLKQDHRAVAQALEKFESADREDKQAIARSICKMLTVHSQIEEELLYPAAREALRPQDAHLVAEAHVEHASLKELIGQIEDREEVDEQYEAKVCVLGEYVKHHVAEEEHELFPRLERTPLDLEALGEQLEERKRELTGEDAEAFPAALTSRIRRATGLHARRR